ncbi:MOSC domain protein [Candidatus Rhodobacter oscarellae]|uniref:MOSC domain protein n=1 Tax=Candidatus Rhodobacter oscarellae TaxID=1675527 RepID=A0A0J9E5K3_9RHOB|nr:MOSC N-terminal beta barrel domain-containing protein [Candidatus Rhodobacter lobularis]KMW57966.1 MOSC domain protein [Candidatus Rhodobacter lobularis]
MTGARVTELWRHPIKGHGRERIEAVTLTAGQTMPWDRVWAVANERSKADGSKWVPCGHFSRTSKAPALMAITAELDEATERLTLRHPDLPDLAFSPDAEPEALVEWSRGLIPEDALASSRIVRAQAVGFTDSDFPSVTLCNMASHRAVEQHLGQPLSIHRWRGNIWLDGLAPWQEWEWLDREIRIGGAVLRGRERTDRCIATTANPDTGRRDADTLGALEHWGHQDFSLRAEVIEAGDIRPGDGVELL